jgi:hypothetical protein
MIRRFALFFILLFVIFLGSVRSIGQAAVSPNNLQETAYVVDTPTPYDDPYAGPATDTPSPYEGPSSPTPSSQTPTSTTHLLTPLTPTSSPQPGSTQLVTVSPTITTSPTSGPSPTAGRDLFGTEDAEMSNSRVTPPPSDTPAPSITPTPSASPTATPAPPAGFLFNPIWFFGGLAFSLSVFLVAWFVIRAKGSGEFG